MVDARAVVTGIGVVTPIDQGGGIDAFWHGLCSGRNAVRPIRSFDTTGCACVVGGEISDSALAPAFAGDDRCARLFAHACRSAVSDAGIRPGSVRAGISFGTILGGMSAGLKYMDRAFFGDGTKVKSLMREYPAHAIPASAASALSLRGPNICVSTACSSGADAIGLAAREICNGRADLMLAGGADAVNEFVFRGFLALNALTVDGCVRPFDCRRTGLAVSEGAAALVLENAASAMRRGARIYCALAGYGATGDGYHLVRPRPDGEGLARAIRSAMAESGAGIEEIGYISAHGTGTVHNDAAETNALKAAFGDCARRIPASSIKSMIGHAMGASAAIEAVCCVKVLETGIIPPTINCEQPDPACDLDCVPGVARDAAVGMAVSVSAGFGGQNSALVFRKEPTLS